MIDVIIFNYPLNNPKNQNEKKKRKKNEKKNPPGDINILYMCTKNYQMMYGS